MPDNKNNNGNNNDQNQNWRELFESVESGNSKPIDISLMTGQPKPTNNKNGDD